MTTSLNAKLIDGGNFRDLRGSINFVNDFDLSPIKRFYTTTNASIDVIRAWQGHKIESRWFYCVQGSFDVRLIKIDNWENPSKIQLLEKFKISANNPEVLHIPKGYINGFKALENNSQILIFSDYKLNEIADDNYRFDKKLWTNWLES